MNRGLKSKFYKVKYVMSLDWYDLLLYKYGQRLANAFRKQSLENDMIGYRRLLSLLAMTKEMQGVINQMINCYQLRGINNSEYEQQYFFLLQQAEELDADMLTLYRWKSMQGAAFNLGLFSLGLCFRNKAIEKVKLHQDEKRYRYQRFLIALEEQDYSYANKLLADMENAKESKHMSSQLEMARQYLCIMCNDERYFEMEYKQLATEDKDFYDAVKREDFILFGPVYEDLSAYNIQEDTKMIRINYAGESTLGEAVKYKNVWMSYYRRIDIIRQFDGDNVEDEFGSVEYLIDSRDSVPKIYHDKRVRIANDISALHFEGFNYMAPIMLFDLAKMGRRKIRITGVNLFHGLYHDKSYHRALLDKDEANKRLAWNSFYRHSVITQFIMVKNMRAAGVIEPIGVLNEILDLSLEQYVTDLEKIYVMEGIC